MSGHAGLKFPTMQRPTDDWGSVVDRRAARHAVFFWENIRGIRESSDKALKIMKATTVMAVVI